MVREEQCTVWEPQGWGGATGGRGGVTGGCGDTVGYWGGTADETNSVRGGRGKWVVREEQCAVWEHQGWGGTTGGWGGVTGGCGGTAGHRGGMVDGQSGTAERAG